MRMGEFDVIVFMWCLFVCKRKGLDWNLVFGWCVGFVCDVSCGGGIEGSFNGGVGFSKEID